MAHIVEVIEIEEEDCHVKGVRIRLNNNDYYALGSFLDHHLPGDKINIEFSFLDFEYRTWYDLFNSNFLKEIKMERIVDWEYEVYGQIKSIKPIMVDVGDFLLDLGELSNDERIIGEYIKFKIDRLEIMEIK